MRRLAILGSCFLILACVSVTENQKPVAPFGDKVEKELAILSSINPALADELRRLPELRRGLDEKGTQALHRIVTFYTQSQNPEEVKQIFDRILSIGKKERRKFSAPLQALFWLAEENEIPLNKNPLTLPSKERYRTFNKHLGEDEEVIQFVYNVWKKTYNTDKWKDPSEIMDRLNSPHLFDLFFSDNIAYDFAKLKAIVSERRGFEYWFSYIQSAKLTIKTRKGVCLDAANMAVEILKKSGYEVKPLQVKYLGPCRISGTNRHFVGLLKENRFYFKIADTYYIKEGVVGPFKSIKEIAEAIAEFAGTSMAEYSLSLGPIR